MKVSQEDEFRKIRDQIYDEIKTDKAGGMTIGSKVGMIFDTIERMRTDIEYQLNKMQHEINIIRNSNIGSVSGGKGQGYHKKARDRPILEYKSIGNLPQIGNNKTEYRSWKDRLRNALRGIYDKEIAWKFWMDVAERHHRNVAVIRDEGYKLDQGMDAEYDEIADVLITILQD